MIILNKTRMFLEFDQQILNGLDRDFHGRFKVCGNDSESERSLRDGISQTRRELRSVGHERQRHSLDFIGTRNWREDSNSVVSGRMKYSIQTFVVSRSFYETDAITQHCRRRPTDQRRNGRKRERSDGRTDERTGERKIVNTR